MTRTTFIGAYPTIAGTPIPGAVGDDITATLQPIGFTFTYNAVAYTTVNVCSNGWINFTTSSSTAANSSLGTTTGPNATLAPWWDDLSSSSVQSLTTGSPGSQVFTIQWVSLSRFSGSTRTINFQVKLYETTNVIEFWYGTISGTNANGSALESASIGVENQTGGPGNFIDAVSGSNQIFSGTLNGGQWPTLNYRFTPGAPTSIAAGAYNVGVGQTYTTLTEAVADINHRGISGAVILNLTDASYTDKTAGGAETFPIVFGTVTGSSATNTITITGNGADLRYAGSVEGTWGNGSATGTMFGITAEPILGVCGTDFLTVNNIKLTALTGVVFGAGTGTPTRVDRGLAVQNSGAVNGATNNNFNNITITLDRTNTSTMAIDQGTSTAPTSAAGANSTNKYKDLIIKNTQKGILLGGNATFPDIGCEIGTALCTNFNTIGDPATANDIGNTTIASYGINATNQSGVLIYNNSIRNVTGSAILTDGINVVTFQGTCSVYNNKIQTIKNSSTTSTTAIAGIRASHTTTGTHTLRIYNNSVSEIISSYTGAASATRTIKGIFVASAGGGTTTQVYQVYNNSVSIDGSASLNISSTCFEHGTSSGPVYNLANNIFANFTAAQGATAKHSGVFSTSATSLGNTGSTYETNDVYIANDAGTSGFTANGGGTTYNGVAAWQTAMTQATGNLELNPLFTNATSDLHIGASGLNGTGQAPPGYVTVDLDCATRTPDNDIGAYKLDGCTAAVGGTASFTGGASACVGSTKSMSSAGASPAAAGLTYQWEVSLTGGGVGFANVVGGTGATTTSYTTGVLTAGTYFYRLNVTCSNGPVTGFSNEITLTVNALPTVTVSPTSGSLCQPGASPITLTGGGASTYAWSPATGLSATTGAIVDANPASTQAYVVTGTDVNGCTNTAMATVTVADAVSTSVSATPSPICSGENSQLLASGLQSFTTPAAASYGFAGSTGTYSAITGTTLPNGAGDEVGNGNLPIGFTFNYNSTNQTVFAAHSNGFLILGNTTPTISGNFNFTNALATGSLFIAPLWDDNNTTDGSIIYSTTGTAPTRVLTVQWTGIHIGGNGSATNPTINMQVKLYEGSNRIEFIYGSTSAALSSTTASIGISGASGNYLSVTPLSPANTSTVSSVSENTTISSSTNFPSGTVYTFTPTGAPVFSYSWSPATFLSATNIANPLATAVTSSQTYTVTVTGNGGCSNTASVNVDVSSGASITSEPVSDSKCVGQTATFTVAADGPSLTYQWRKGGVDIPIGGNPSAGTLTLSLSNVMAGDAGVYDVIVTSTCGSPVMSNGTSTLTVNAIPTASATNDGPKCEGSVLNLSGTHSGGDTFNWTGPASYSASTQNAVRSGLILAHSGTYTFTTTSTAGCTSDPATTSVSVNASPSAIIITPLGTVVLCPTSPAELLTTSGGTTKSSVTLNSGTLNLTIPDDTPTGVSNALTVSGIPMGATIDSIIAILNISHTFDGDLTLTLQGPNTNIEILSDQRGGSGDNYTNTRFTSDASKPSITTGTPPFNGTFSAEGLLGNLVSMVNGNWTLKAVDVDAGATGTLNNWSLTVYFSTPTSITWAPATGLYTDAAATMAYTGTATNMVYAKPVSTETFTATASTEAQFTLDGNINESGWGAALATSAGGPAPLFGAGHELNALYVQGGDKVINFGIAGDVQNGNRILLFIDSKTGGYTNGSFGRTGAPQGIDDFNSGTTFDAGFEADYCLVIGTNVPHDNFFFDLYTLSAGGGPAVYLGDISDPKIGADPLTASNTRGFEIAILKTLLGFTGGTVKVFAMYISDGGFLDNQFLTRAGSGDGSYGSGAVTFGAAMPDPVTVPLANLQSYCTSTATVTVGIEGTVVKSTADAGLNTLRSVYGCITEGGTITYDQLTTTTTVLTADMPINKNVTIQGLSDVARPEITLPAGGISTSSGKTLTLQNVDLKSSGSATFTGTGDVIILMDAITVIKQ